MKIVMNTSPVIFLGKIGCLHLLRQCVTEVIIPEAVLQELGDYNLPDFIKIKVLSATGTAYVRGAFGQLHQGELSAIVLAQELLANFVILDDLLARRKAQRLQINVMGTLGLLLLMKKSSIITPQQTWCCIDELINAHGMYLSKDMIAQLHKSIMM